MNNNRVFGSVSIFVLLTIVSAQVSFSQIKLRNAADYDGDGKADFNIFRPADAVWYVAKSNGGYLIQQFGNTDEDFMTPGDYDGDGKGDIAVWRDTTGVWFRINSLTNTFSATQFGTKGDEPVARDYDGDGKTDLAVVRRTNGQMIWC